MPDTGTGALSPRLFLSYPALPNLAGQGGVFSKGQAPSTHSLQKSSPATPGKASFLWGAARLGFLLSILLFLLSFCMQPDSPCDHLANPPFRAISLRSAWVSFAARALPPTAFPMISFIKAPTEAGAYKPANWSPIPVFST